MDEPLKIDTIIIIAIILAYFDYLAVFMPCYSYF